MSAVMSIEDIRRGLSWRKNLDKMFVVLGLLVLMSCLGVLLILFLDLVRDGAGRFGWDFFTQFPSRKAERAGILSAWVGTSMIMLVTAVVALPVGVAAAIYLEEYAPKNWMTSIIEINVTNLAGVPSIVYGLLALGLFVYQFDFGQSVLSAGLTLALLILPIIIVGTREAVAGRAEGDSRGGLWPWRHALGGHQGSRAAVFHGRHPHWPDPGAVARHRRDRAHHHHRGVELHRVPAGLAHHGPVPVLQL